MSPALLILKIYITFKDVQMMLNIFLISLLVSDFLKSVWSVPSIPVAVLDPEHSWIRHASSKDGLDQRTDSLRFSLFLPLKHHRHLLVSITSFINSVIVTKDSKVKKKKIAYFIFPQCYIQLLYWAPLCITLKIRIWVVAYFFNFFQLFQNKKKKIYKSHFM